jgi:hypothetical protein
MAIDLPFSLNFRGCAAGMNVASYEIAKTGRWTGTDYVSVQPMANCVGITWLVASSSSICRPINYKSEVYTTVATGRQAASIA